MIPLTTSHFKKNLSVRLFQVNSKMAAPTLTRLSMVDADVTETILKKYQFINI